MVGRPTSYTEELGERICNLISVSTIGTKKLCEENDWMPCYATVKNWLRTHDYFLALYTRAKDDQADILVEEMLEIADDKKDDTVTTEFGSQGNSIAIARARLQIDTRKFIASKLKPKKYGDKLDLTTNGENMNKPAISTDHLTVDEIKQLLAD